MQVLRRGGSIGNSVVVHAIEIHCAGGHQLDAARLIRGLRSRGANISLQVFLSLVVEPSGYIQAHFQEIALQLFGGEIFAGVICDMADRIRDVLNQYDPVPPGVWDSLLHRLREVSVIGAAVRCEPGGSVHTGCNPASPLPPGLIEAGPPPGFSQSPPPGLDTSRHTSRRRRRSVPGQLSSVSRRRVSPPPMVCPASEPLVVAHPVVDSASMISSPPDVATPGHDALAQSLVSQGDSRGSMRELTQSLDACFPVADADSVSMASCGQQNATPASGSSINIPAGSPGHAVSAPDVEMASEGSIDSTDAPHLVHIPSSCPSSDLLFRNINDGSPGHAVNGSMASALRRSQPGQAKSKAKAKSRPRLSRAQAKAKAQTVPRVRSHRIAEPAGGSTSTMGVHHLIVQYGELLSSVDLQAIWLSHTRTIPEVPQKIRPLWLSAMHKVSDELASLHDRGVGDDQFERTWRLFILLPQLLLRKPSRGGGAGRREVLHRFDLFRSGDLPRLLELLHRSMTTYESGIRSSTLSIDQINNRVSSLLDVGEVSRAAATFSQAPLAPGTSVTLDALRSNRAQVAQPLSAEVLGFECSGAPVLTSQILVDCLRSAGRKKSASLSGWRNEHMRPLLESPEAWDAFTSVCQFIAEGRLPQCIQDVFRLARITAAIKPDGVRIRPLAAGDSLRRLVGRALARQCTEQVRDAISPYQFGVGVRSGCEVVIHSLQVLLDSNPNLCLLSIDGIGAFDYISRQSMLSKLIQTCPELYNFVMMFYRMPSVHWRYGDQGTPHSVVSVDGGDQGDPLMPALFSLGLDSALRAIAAELINGEHLFAFLDDLYIITTRDRLVDVFSSCKRHLHDLSGIDVHTGKPCAWSPSGGSAPDNWSPSMWRDSGVSVLGCPIGSAPFVQAQLPRVFERQQKLHVSISKLASVQHAWVLLQFCAASMSNYVLRTVPPSLSSSYRCARDAAVVALSNSIQGWTDGECSLDPRGSTFLTLLPVRFGGLGLRCSGILAVSSFWSSWADCVPTMQNRSPEVSNLILRFLQPGPVPMGGRPYCLENVWSCVTCLLQSHFPVPSWSDLFQGVRAPARLLDDGSVGCWEHGWQFHASNYLYESSRNRLMASCSPRLAAVIRSGSDCVGSRWLTTIPSSPEVRVSNDAFQFGLRRRLGRPVGTTVGSCPGVTCEAQVDLFGDHLNACMRTGRVQRRHTVLVDAWAQIFVESGAAVWRERLLRETNLSTPLNDARRMDLVVQGLPVARGLPLFCDVTVCSPVDPSGGVRLHSDTVDGAVLLDRIGAKHRVYNDVRTSHTAELVVLGCEIFGRCSPAVSSILASLAKHCVQPLCPWVKKSAQLAWQTRWSCILSTALLKASASTGMPDLGDYNFVHPTGGAPHLSDIIGMASGQ